MVCIIKYNAKDIISYVLLILTLCYTLIYSSGGMTDISNHDYMYYMHLCSDSDYSRHPMISGTLLIYKPLFSLFGFSFWKWQKFHWMLNLVTIFIPYFVLLNGSQRRRYLFVAILLVLIAHYRMGCEPPRLVYFFGSITLTCLIKYFKINRFVWILIMSICLSLIGYVRFPSLLVYPLVALAVICFTNRIMHRITILLLPIVLFLILVSITSGSVQQFFSDLSNSLNDSITGDHSMKLLFFSCAQSLVCDAIYTVILLLPFSLYILWKKLKYRILLVATCFSFILSLCSIFYYPAWGDEIPHLYLANITFSMVYYHPIPQLFGAFFIVVIILYLYDYKFDSKTFILGLIIIFSAMAASAGSNFGFVHEYMSMAFLPYFASLSPSIDIQQAHKCKYSKPSLRLWIVCLCIAMIVSTLMNDVRTLHREFCSEGKIAVINGGGKLAENLDNVYFGEQSFGKLTGMQKEYK